MSARPTTSRFKPLPPEEKAVCRRIAEARKLAGLSKAALCERVRMSYDRLANIECGRVRLKWEAGEKICRALDLSQLWVAAGAQPMRPFMNVATDQMLFQDAPFSAICLGKLRKELELRRDLALGTDESPEMSASEDAIVQALSNVVRNLLPGVEKKDRLAFLERAPAALRKVIFDLGTAAIRRAYSTTTKSTSLLTDDSEIRKVEPMFGLQELLGKVRRLTESRGVKVKLAKSIGVPQPRISEWLAGKYEPSGETTLRLLQWVEQQELQQNTLGSDTNTTKGKTQVRKSPNEKQTQVRKKG